MVIERLPEVKSRDMKTIRSRVKQAYPEFISDLKRHDSKAFEYLYDNYHQALFGTVHRIVQDWEVAEEVFHDAFIKIHKKIASYDEAKGRLFTWMLNICRNAAIDKLKSKDFKKQAKTDGIDGMMEGILNQHGFEYSIDSIGVEDLLGKLSPDYRFVIYMLYFKGYSQAEISKEFKIPLGTVKTRSRAGLRDLRKLID